ncbi:hypothetical protein MRX96_002505 [Rhipicephalus microplus]
MPRRRSAVSTDPCSACIRGQAEVRRDLSSRPLSLSIVSEASPSVRVAWQERTDELLFLSPSSPSISRSKPGTALPCRAATSWHAAQMENGST